MINPKNICISACVGFFLSFFIGLVSPGVNFSHVLLRASIFALVFAALCIGITFVYQKFLIPDSSGFSESEQNLQKTAGGVVNIVVDDSNLVDDGMAPKFTVLNNHSAFSEKQSSEENSTAPSTAVSSPQESSVSAQAVTPAPEPAEPVQADSSSFQPANLAAVTTKNEDTKTEDTKEGVSDSKPKTVSKETEDGSLSQNGSSSETQTQQLDELPDIGSIDSDSGAGTASELDSASVADEVVTDTDFSTGGAHLKEQPISGDTNVMAKAIQTLLAKDND